MFRKKKQVGSVTVYDDDGPPAHSRDMVEGSAEDDFADLGLSSSRAARNVDDLTEADMNNMTAAELEELALASAREGKDGTQRALNLALETRQIGVNTAQTLKAQTEQLEHMGEDIEIVHNYLDKSEKIIDKMSKPKIVRMFRGKKGGGKGLDKVRGNKKDMAEREELRGKGLHGMDLDGMAGGDDDDDDGEGDREELFEVQDHKKSKKGKSKGPKSPRSAREVHEDYSQYSSGVASAMREQDEDLDQISDALADMKALADGMNNELNYQEKLIAEVQDFTEETSTRTKDHARRVNNIR